MNLTALEKALLPIASPLLLQLWEGTLLPAIQDAAKSGSPEVQILETEAVAFIDRVVKAELAKLGAVS